MKTYLITIILLFATISTCYGQMGFILSSGNFSQSAMGDNDINYNFTWDRIGLFNHYNLNTNWTANWENKFGFMKWWSQEGHHNVNANSFTSDIAIYRHVYKKIYLGGSAGFSTIFDPNGLPNLGNSGLYGTFSGRVKYQATKDFGIVLSLDHISDAFQDAEDGDGGKNVISISFCFML